MHSWSIFGAQMSHGHMRIHKTHHDPDLGEATTFVLIVFSVINHGGYIQMWFCPRTPNLGVPKIFKLGILRLWRPITSHVDLQLKWGLKQSCSPPWEIFYNMWYTTCTQVNKGDSWILMGRSQICTWTSDLYFGHNLCFKYSNGSCEHILDIYVSRAFQWYKENFNPMSLAPKIVLQNLGSPSRLQLSKWELTWECVGSFPHSPTLPRA